MRNGLFSFGTYLISAVTGVASVRTAIAWLLLFAGWSENAEAAIAFNIVKAVPVTIEVGQTAVFNINIFSTTGPITNLAGIDFRINANDPAFTGNANFGRFSAGTTNFFPAGSATYLFPFSPPTSNQIFSASNNVGLPLSTSPTLLATLTLNAAGATPGVYAMALTDLTAVDPAFNELGTIPASLTYEIVAAVPEPSSLLLVVGAVCAW